MGTNESEIDVNMKATNRAQVKATQAGIRRVISQLPRPILTSNGFLTERINETLSGYRTPVVVNVYGNDLDQLDQQAAEIARMLGRMKGAAQVQLQSPPGMPQIVVRPRQEDVARWGFDPVEVLDVVRTAYGSDVAGQIYEGNRVFEVSVVLAPSSRLRVNEIGRLPLRSPEGNYVTLSQLADINERSGTYVILHQGARQVQTITCNVQGREVSSFVDEAKKRIGLVNLLALPTLTLRYGRFEGSPGVPEGERL
jgi:Cu/Ag efflux pump CusA